MRMVKVFVLTLVGLTILPNIAFAEIYANGPDVGGQTKNILSADTVAWTNEYTEKAGFVSHFGFLYVSDGSNLIQIKQFNGDQGWFYDYFKHGNYGGQDLAHSNGIDGFLYKLHRNEWQVIDTPDSSNVATLHENDVDFPMHNVDAAVGGDKIYWATNDGMGTESDTLYAVTAEETPALVWKRNLSSHVNDIAIDGNNNVYLAYGDGLISFSSDGNERFDKSFHAGSARAIGANESGDLAVHHVAKDSDVISKHDNNGNEQCSFDRFYDDFIAKNVDISQNQNIYYGYGDNSTTHDLSTTGGNIRKLDENCNPIWVNQYFPDDNYVNAVIVGHEVDTPIADFTFSPDTIAVGDTFDFHDESTGAEGIIAEWSWTFNDGDTSLQQNPSHSYRNRGSYDVNLTVKDILGRIDSATETVEVKSEEDGEETGGIAGITATDTDVKLSGKSATLTDTQVNPTTTNIFTTLTMDAPDLSENVTKDPLASAKSDSVDRTSRDYRFVLPLSKANRDTVTVDLWTNQHPFTVFYGLRSDTMSVDMDNLPPGLTHNDTGLKALGRTAFLLEFADSENRVLGSDTQTTAIGDSFAYVLEYDLSQETTEKFENLGFDTSAESNNFQFAYADTFAGEWISDTLSVAVESRTDTGISVRVGVLKKDLPGALAGKTADDGTEDGVGEDSSTGSKECVLERSGLPVEILGSLRSLRDKLLTSTSGRMLTRLYYRLGK